MYLIIILCFSYLATWLPFLNKPIDWLIDWRSGCPTTSDVPRLLVGFAKPFRGIWKIFVAISRSLTRLLLLNLIQKNQTPFLGHFHFWQYLWFPSTEFNNTQLYRWVCVGVRQITQPIDVTWSGLQKIESVLASQTPHRSKKFFTIRRQLFDLSC